MTAREVLDGIKGRLTYPVENYNFVQQAAAENQLLKVDMPRLTRAIEDVLATPHIEHGLDADTRFTNGYNEALNRIRAAIEDALNPKEGHAGQ